MKRKKRGDQDKLLNNLTKSLLQYIQGKRYKPATYEELIQQINIAPIHEKKFQEILLDLVNKKLLVFQRNKYAIPTNASLATGIISVHPKGFGFVKMAEGGPDVFIPRHALQEAVHGDEVEIEIAQNPSPKGPEGIVIAILKRSRTSLAGTVTGKSGRLYTAFCPLLGPDKPILVKAKAGSLKEGDRIIASVTCWSNKQEVVEGTLSRLIGHISDPSIDIEAAVAEFELPDGFSKEALDEAKHFGKKVSIKDTKNRLDLTDQECITIDPDTARDFDDAISLTEDENGHFHLGVHIADVSHYVQSGAHLDLEAYERCNSTYFPGQCVPMLPEELSNDLCSLKQKVKRLTQSVLAEFDSNGNLIRYDIRRTIIKSRKRLTYKAALAILENKVKSSHTPLLNRMVKLCHLLKQKRFERGSIDFAMADNVILVDEKGTPLRIEKNEYDITHQMIEEFMLKANEIVASHLNKQGKTLIYRVHEEPGSESFKDFYAFARTLGFHLPAQPNHRDIQKLFLEAKDSPLLPQLSVNFIRSMRLASYSSDNIGHYGLALEHYCHFTSPIRRYTDLIIQRLLFNELPSDCDINAIAEKCSEKERISFRAEKSVVLLKKLRLAYTYFSEDATRIYPALITKIKPFALFFEVPLFDLEASLHVSKIGNDYFEFDPKRETFRGRHTGKTFTVGQILHVRLDKIDYIFQQTEWAIVPPPPTHSASKKKFPIS